MPIMLIILPTIAVVLVIVAAVIVSRDIDPFNPVHEYRIVEKEFEGKKVYDLQSLYTRRGKWNSLKTFKDLEDAIHMKNSLVRDRTLEKIPGKVVG